VIPPTVKEIKEDAFPECTQLSLAILQNGLEVIGSGAFSGTSIKSIKIPPLLQIFGMMLLSIVQI
jgi:hypothetical protein